MPQHKNPCPGIMKFIVLVQFLVRIGQVVLEMLKHEALKHDEQKTDAKRFYSSQSIFTISLSYPFEQNTTVQEKKIFFMLSKYYFNICSFREGCGKTTSSLSRIALSLAPHLKNYNKLHQELFYSNFVRNWLSHSGQ